MYTTHSKGMLGELGFTYSLIENGYSVLMPVNHNSSYDLVAEKEGVFTRIQVKYSTPINGILRIELFRPKRNTKRYFDREVDAMGVYNPISKKSYLVPMSVIKKQREFWIRIDEPRGKRSKSMHFADQFEI